MLYHFPKWEFFKLLISLFIIFAVCSCVSLNDEYYYNRLIAVNRIYNQKVLLKVAFEDKDWRVKNAAFGKLNNKSLTEICTLASGDQAMIIAAKIRLKQTSWSEEFSKSSKSDSSLGNVIGAAALVNSPQPASYDVVSACHNYISKGDASRIPELINLLNRFGDSSLAEDYMNCGQSTLSDAGCTWGTAHGYRCTTGSGSHRVSWGSGK